MPLGYSAIADASLGASGSASKLPAVATTFAVTGVQATGSVGAVTIRAKATVRPTDYLLVPMAGRLTPPTTSGKGNVTVTGVRGTATLGALSSVSSSGRQTVFLSGGVTATGRVGDVGVSVLTANAYANPTSLTAIGSVGVVTVPGVASSYPIDVAGIDATGYVGDVTVVLSPNIVAYVPAMVMGQITGVTVLTSSFGTNLTNVQPSSWTPIKPV